VGLGVVAALDTQPACGLAPTATEVDEVEVSPSESSTVARTEYEPPEL
jgi:hypothetical protein